MTQSIKLFETVALAEDIPEHGLFRGQVGAVVEIYGSTAVEVDFSDSTGRTYALLSIPPDKLIPLHFQPLKAAG
jgi:hypothetical protein